jgi:hypothetical protein
MMITRKAMHRRTVLRGVRRRHRPAADGRDGPSAKAVETAAAARKRLQVIYTPNGMQMENWTSRPRPASDYEMTAILKPLEPTAPSSR